MKQGNALTQMCPMVSRGGNNEDNRCVASDCMAWRWINSESGFCGLAGPLVCTAGSGPSRPADLGPAEVSLVDNFVVDFCFIDATYETPAEDVFNKFVLEKGECMSAKRFGQIITRNCERIKRGGTVYYKGLGLK